MRLSKIIFILLWVGYVIRIFFKRLAISSTIGEIIGFTIFWVLLYLLITKFRYIKRIPRKIRLRLMGGEFNIEH